MSVYYNLKFNKKPLHWRQIVSHQNLTRTRKYYGLWNRFEFSVYFCYTFVARKNPLTNRSKTNTFSVRFVSLQKWLIRILLTNFFDSNLLCLLTCFISSGAMTIFESVNMYETLRKKKNGPWNKKQKKKTILLNFGVVILVCVWWEHRQTGVADRWV